MSPEQEEKWRAFLTAVVLEYGAGPHRDWYDKEWLYAMHPMHTSGSRWSDIDTKRIQSWLVGANQGITEAGLRFIRGECDSARPIDTQQKES